MELWWRTAALQALLAALQGPLAGAPRAEQTRLQRRTAALLKPTLNVLTAHAALQVGWRGAGSHSGQVLVRRQAHICLLLVVPARLQSAFLHHPPQPPFPPPSPRQEPARGKGGPAGMFAGAAALLQLRLLEAYAALPAPAVYAEEQEALTKLCMRTVRQGVWVLRWGGRR